MIRNTPNDIAEIKFYFDKLWKFDIKDDKICNWIKAHAFSLCPLAKWKLFRLWFDSLFFQHKSSVKKNQTTSTFSLKPLVGATLALKALLNCRSSLPFASDDVITYTPLPGRWYPHSLKKSGENIKEYNCHVHAYASYINNLYNRENSYVTWSRSVQSGCIWSPPNGSRSAAAGWRPREIPESSSLSAYPLVPTGVFS